MPDLTILHTNDLHGKLTKSAAEIIAREKSSNERILLLDAGDAVSSGNIYYRPGGEPVLTRMSDIGYEAMALGNREFHFLEAGLKSKVRLARFPVVSANLRSKHEIGSSVVPSITIERDGLRVAVFGLTVPMIMKRMPASKLSPYWFENPISAAAEIVPILRKNADIVIALTHIGMRLDEELAASVPGIDIIVGGHSHSVLQEPKLIGSTYIAQAGWWGHYLGKTEIAIGAPIKVTGRLIDLRT